MDIDEWDRLIHKTVYWMASFHWISQNQLLTKGMVILRDKIRFYEGMSDWIRALNNFRRGVCQRVKGVFWLCDRYRSEVTRLSGRDLGFLFLRRSLDAAGHLPSSSGTPPTLVCFFFPPNDQYTWLKLWAGFNRTSHPSVRSPVKGHRWLLFVWKPQKHELYDEHNDPDKVFIPKAECAQGCHEACWPHCSFHLFWWLIFIDFCVD